MSPREAKIHEISKAPRPETKKQVRAFLGLTGYYRTYIARFAEIALPLTELTKKGKPNRVEWGEKEEHAFQMLKNTLCKVPILQIPDPSKDFILQTDASENAAGAVLMQNHEGMNFPFAYASRKFTETERRYSVFEKECLALVWAVRKFQMYLYGKPFILQTDHQPLVYLNSSIHANGRLMRWALFLQSYQISIEAIRGSENVGADYMSRL